MNKGAARHVRFVNADLIAAGLSPLAPERALFAASRIFMRGVERRFLRGLRHLPGEFSHRAERCTCFMNDGESPALVFGQHGTVRTIVHDDNYQLLLEEANR